MAVPLVMSSLEGKSAGDLLSRCLLLHIVFGCLSRRQSCWPGQCAFDSVMRCASLYLHCFERDLALADGDAPSQTSPPARGHCAPILVTFP